VSERLIEVWVRPREPTASDPPLDDPRAPPPAPLAAAVPDPAAPAGAADAANPPAAAPPAPEEPARLTEVVRPVHARAEDLVTAIAKAARASDVQVAPDTGSNAVVIAGPEPDVLAIARLVYSLDVPRRRFVLEAEIVELSHTARRALGVRWSIEGKNVGAQVDFPAADAPGESSGILVATDGAWTLRARINALEADGHVRIVSRPRVIVLEGRPASIESVRILRVRFPERTAIVGEAEDAGAVAGGRAVEEIPVGVTLRVEPSMRGDGRIVLRIRAKSSTLGPPQPPDDIPEELSRMVDAEVAVADGETAVLGGLLREGTNRSAAGVPVLRSLPVLGTLFGKREREDDGEELLVLVTPRLLPP
jgi:general secretion pathway protein D